MKKSIYFLLSKSLGIYINSLSFVFPKKALQAAYRLFSEPRLGKLSKDKLPKILQNVYSKTFKYDQNYFEAYIWKGNETKVLLIHGWESNSSRWKKMLPHLLQSGSTIIAIDAPAQGLSSGKEFNVPKYAEFMHVAVKKYQPQYLIGHSMGGNTCLYYQHKYKHPSIKKIVILGAPSDFKVILNNYIKLLSLNTRVVKALKSYIEHTFQIDIEQFSASKFASELDIKGLIVHDIDDKVVLFNEGKKIADSWKNAIFIETKGLGHRLHNDELNTKICNFLFEKSGN